MKNNLVLSTLGHTWILDLDGTVVKHNGYKLDGKDTFLDGAAEFLRSIPERDMIIFLTSRSNAARAATEQFLKENRIRYDHIVFEAPYGERILINDSKPSGLKMGISLSTERDQWAEIVVKEDPTI